MRKNTKVFAGVFVCSFLVIIIAVMGFVNKKQITPYEQLCENGYTGTEEDLLNSLMDEDKNLGIDTQNPKSAYDSATENNYKGSKKDWLDTLIGDGSNANRYTNDKSVYDLAVEVGYCGTLEEWIESLREPLDKSDVNTTTKKHSSNGEENNINDSYGENISTSDAETIKESNEFTVIFKNYDGTVLKTELVMKGSTATPPETPERDGYIFVGWDRTFNSVNTNIIVNAMFEKITKPTIIVSRVDTSQGENKVAVDIALLNNPGISSLNLKVSYASQLTLNRVEYNKNIKGQSMKPGQNESPITLMWVSPFEDVKGDWVYATLYFDVEEQAKGDLPVTITYDVNNIYNVNEENIYFDVINGAIAITE